MFKLEQNNWRDKKSNFTMAAVGFWFCTHCKTFVKLIVKISCGHYQVGLVGLKHLSTLTGFFLIVSPLYPNASEYNSCSLNWLRPFV